MEIRKDLRKLGIVSVSALTLLGIGASASQVLSPVHASRISSLRARRGCDYRDIKSINAKLNKLERKSSRKKNSKVAPIRPVNTPSWLNGYWIRDDSTDMHVTGLHAHNYKARQQRYWQINKNGRDVPYITSFNFGKGGSHFAYRHGKYFIKNGQHPYAITYYQPTGHNRIKISITMKSRGHGSIKKFRGSYYKVSHHRFQDINNSLDSVNHYNFNK